jgi:hypothetical protein
MIGRGTVGWAKPTGSALGRPDDRLRVPTRAFVSTADADVGTAQVRLCPPYEILLCHTPGSIPVLRMTGAASGAVRKRSSARPASAAVAPLCTPAENTVTSWMSAGSAPR